MITNDPNHKHTYDAQGNITCCMLEDKINADVEKHSNADGHQHETSGESNLKLFRPALISFALLLSAIAMDNYFTIPNFRMNSSVGAFCAVAF